MSFDFDYIIIGSGFGGSVSALRLSEKGYRVLVIEKGKDFSNPGDFPKSNWNLRKWMWLPSFKFFGIQKLTFFRHISILSGVGVGGGSLVYANTLPKPKSEFFRHGSWRKLDDWEDSLAPFYDKAWQMLGASENKKFTGADLALKELSENLGKSDSFSPTKVGVYFGKEGETVEDPYHEGKGPTRTGCIFCGACMTGCRYGAKNTLDKNYLHLAQGLGAEILPEKEVVNVVPLEEGEGGYEIVFKSSTKYFAKQESLKSRGVIFSGGVLGTLPLLLKLKETTLPKLSPRLGESVRTNNEALIINVTDKLNTDFSKGVAIGSILEVDDDSHLEPVRYGSGSGFWRLLLVPMISDPNFFRRMAKLIIEPFRNPIKWFKILTVRDFAKQSAVHLFMQHLDSSIKFKRSFFGMKSVVSRGENPSAFIPEAHKLAKDYSDIIDGKPMTLFTESITGIPSTAHILGGCCMGESALDGVIDKNNKVFNYDNMYVFDGSMISANPGVNPSLSITAITEYGLSKFKNKTS